MVGKVACSLLAGVAVAIASAQSAGACRCIEPGPAESYGRAAAVVRANVIKVVAAPEGPGSTAILKVSQAWKSEVPEELAVTTVTTCAFDWRQGKGYFLFLVRDGTGFFSTGRCLGNQPVDSAAELVKWLGEHGASVQVRRLIGTE